MPASCWLSPAGLNFGRAWFTRADVTTHSLTRLSRSEVAAMTEIFCEGQTMPQ